MELAHQWAQLLPTAQLASSGPSTPSWPSEWSQWFHREELLRRGSDGRTLTYEKRGWRAKGPASAQSNFPIPAGVPFYYFEVEILNGPEKDAEEETEPSNNYIRIGFGETHSPATAMPGDSFDSVGYGNDGVVHLGCDRKQGRPIKLRFYQGDTVGCGFAFSTQQFIIAVKRPRGPCVYEVVQLPPRACEQSPLYPKVGLELEGVKVMANFGQQSFKFDVASYLRDNLLITTVKLPPIVSPSISSPRLSPAQRQCRDRQREELYPAAIALHSRLPACWNRDDRRRNMVVGADCLTLRLSDQTQRDGSNVVDDSAAAIRADCPLPDEGCKAHYFEVLITAIGENNGSAKIGVGHALESAHLGEMVGWRYTSHGIHTHNCRTYTDSLLGSKLDDFTKRPFTVGDVVGCGLDFGKLECFFTLNGKYLGRLVDVRKSAEMRHQALYPIVSIASVGTEVAANFGQEPFQFPIAEYIEKVCSADTPRRELIAFRQRIEAQPPPGYVPPAKQKKKANTSAQGPNGESPSPLPLNRGTYRATRANRPVLEAPLGDEDEEEPVRTPLVGDKGKRRRNGSDRSDDSIPILTNETEGGESAGATRSGMARQEDIAGPSNANGTLSVRQTIYAMQHIVPAILSGQIADSLRMIERELPGNFLSRELHLRFKLREYVEVVAAIAGRAAHLNEESFSDSAASSDIVCLKAVYKSDAQKDADLRRIGREITSLFTHLSTSGVEHNELSSQMNSVLALPNWDADSAFSREWFDEKHRLALAKQFQAALDA